MERAEWLEYMRRKAELLYDHFSHLYWVKWGMSVDEMHQTYLQKFLARLSPGSRILSAACGAGRFEGLLLDAGHSVVGIDQSAGVLEKAREHFPQAQFPRLRYEKLGMQELASAPAYHEAFDGVICMDAMEHICPEDWPGIVRGFQTALKPGGLLYFTADVRAAAEIEASYRRAMAMGLPVVYGEIADEVEAAYQQAMEGGEVRDQSVYHYSPSVEQIQAWLAQAGLVIEEEGADSEYHYFVARKRRETFQS